MVQWWALIATSVMVVATAAGNVLVCLAITWERRLQNMTNYFLMSLAITDLMVAILVMPLGILTLVIGSFPLEPVYCLTWISLDVLFCTASIMHLCTISVDRYLSLRYPMKFGRNKTRRRVILKIAFVWLLSIAMCLPLSLRYSKDYNQVLVKGVCQIPDPVYKLIGSIVSFYIPLGVMLITFALTVRLLAQQQQNLGDTSCQWFNTPPMERGAARRSTWRRLFTKGSSPSSSRHLHQSSSSPLAPLSLTPSHHLHHSSQETEMSALDHHDLWLQDTEPPPPSTFSALHQFGAELLKLSRGLESLPPKIPDSSQEVNHIEDLVHTSPPRPEDLKEEKNTINFLTSGSSLTDTTLPLKTHSLRLVRKGACRRRTRASTIHVDSPQRNSLKRTSIEIRKRITSYHGPSNRWGTSDSSSPDEGKDAEEGKEEENTEEKDKNKSKTTPKSSLSIEYKRFDNQQTNHKIHRRRYSHPHQSLMPRYSCIRKCNLRCRNHKTDKHNHCAHVSSTINSKSGTKDCEDPIMDKFDTSREVSDIFSSVRDCVCSCSHQESIRNILKHKSSSKDCEVPTMHKHEASGEVSSNVPTSFGDNACTCSHQQTLRKFRICEAMDEDVHTSNNNIPSCSNLYTTRNCYQRTYEGPIMVGDVPTTVNSPHNNNVSSCSSNHNIIGNTDLRICEVPTTDISHCATASKCCKTHHIVGNYGCSHMQRLAYSCGDIRRVCSSELVDMERTSSSEFCGKNDDVSKKLPSPNSDRISEKNSGERHSMMLLPPPCRCPYFGDVENDKKTSPNRTNEVVIVTSSTPPQKSPLRRRSKQYSLKTSESDDTASTASTPLHFTPHSGRTSSTVTLGSVKRKSGDTCDPTVTTRNNGVSTVVTWETPQPFGHRRGSSFGSGGTARTMVMTSERNRFSNLRRAVTLKMPKHNGQIFAPTELSRVSSTSTLASKNSKIRGPYSRNSSILFRTSSRHGRIIRLEQKATKVLGVVFFTFVILWAPFFILNLLPSICGDCEKDIGKGVFDFATWLGYASSMVNPIFYTIFNKVFRQAFKKVLLCKYHRKETWKPTKPNK